MPCVTQFSAVTHTWPWKVHVMFSLRGEILISALDTLTVANLTAATRRVWHVRPMPQR